VAGFESAEASAHSQFPLSFDASYRPPWRLLFVSFGRALFFSRSNDLVSLAPAVRRLVADCFRDMLAWCWQELESAVSWLARFFVGPVDRIKCFRSCCWQQQFSASLIFAFSG